MDLEKLKKANDIAGKIQFCEFKLKEIKLMEEYKSQSLSVFTEITNNRVTLSEPETEVRTKILELLKVYFEEVHKNLLKQFEEL